MKEITLVKKLIIEVEKNWTKDKCKGYSPDCGNCQGQILLGHLYSYVDLLDWDFENKHEA